MVSVDLIRSHLNRLLSGAESLDDFEDWLASASWNMHLHSDPDAQRLASAVELRLAEYSTGHLDQKELCEELSLILVHGCQSVSLHVQMFMGPAATVSATTVDPDASAASPEWTFRLGSINGNSAGPATAVTRTGSGRTVSTKHDLSPA